MKAAVLLRHAWHRHRLALFFLSSGLFLFEWLITRLAPVPSQAGAIQQLLQLLPPALMQIFGNEIAASLNARGAISFGYTHPFAIVLLAAWTVRIPASGLAGEIGEGTMDLIASRAVPRWASVAAALAALALGLAVIAGAGWLGTAIGVAGRPVLELRAGPFFGVAAALWLLFLAFGCLALLVSALRRTAGVAIGITTAIIAVSFALDFVARSWDAIAWLRPASLFMYFRPQQIATAGLAAGDLGASLGVAAVAALAAFVVFARRDL